MKRMNRNEAILVLLSIKHFFKMDTAEDEALDMAITALEGKDTNVPTWIPVSERLPEKNGEYLVTRGAKAGGLWNRVYIVHYSDLMGLKKEKIFWTGNVGKSDFEAIYDVIAWMPLPEPYKEQPTCGPDYCEIGGAHD